jgi:signal transduction histidine kinase/ligand-binding sensor domain-containing protein/AraC-like DNA-binding protein
MLRSSFFFLVFYFILTVSLTAQNISKWQYQHVDKKSGLSNSAITCIYNDYFDYVWFGSWDGLNRYDGSNIHSYKPNPALKGFLSNNVIRELFEDGKRQLWAVTHSGINRFDRNTDSYKAYLDAVNLPFQEYNLRGCIGPDSSVWVGLNGWGVGHYSAKEDKFIHLINQDLESKWLKSVIGIGSFDHRLFILGSNGQLVCLMNNKIEFSFYVHVKNNLLKNKFLIVNNHLFLVLPTENGSIAIYDLTGDHTGPIIVKLGEAPVSSLSSSQKNGLIWAGTESGNVYRITFEKGHFVTECLDANLSLLVDKKLKVLSITETGQNILWVGTDGDGVYKFLHSEKPFNSLLSGRPDQGLLSNSIVRCVYENADGKLYVGTRGGGLNVLDLINKRNRVYNTSSGLSNDAVLALNSDRKGNLWIGADGEGIDMIEPGSNRILHFPRDFIKNKNVHFASVYSIYIDRNNDLWLGTSGYGVVHLKIEKNGTGKYDLINYEQIDDRGKGNASINSNIVYSIVEEKPDLLWFGTRLGGLYQYSTTGNKILTTIRNSASQHSGLSNNDVLSLCKDSKNQLWIGTSGGLNCLKLGQKPYQIISYTENDGLPNNTIHGILEDQLGGIWISTNSGLSLFNSKDKSFKNFDWNDGLQNNEFTDGAVFKSSISNKLYFGGIDGLDMVSPNKLDTSSFFPRLALTEFQVHNVIVSPNDKTGLLTRHIDFTDKLTLSYSQNFLSFYFTVLDYWNKQRCKYAYYLEGFDKTWINLTKQGIINLTNVPPGKYKLLIKYTNENGKWNSQVRKIDIIIRPPFWAGYTAYFVYLLIIIVLLLYLRIRLVAKKTRAMEKFKYEQEEELNNYKLQFFTNIAHEFRTPLTLIMGHVATLLKRDNDDLEKNYLTTVFKNSLRLQKLIQELMEFRKIETGRANVEVSEIDLNLFTREIIELFLEYSVEQGIQLSFEPCATLSKGYVDPNKIERILVNLISNAIKYTRPGGKVIVKLCVIDGFARFEITDTGVGIPSEIIEKIFDPFFHGSESFPEMEGIAKGTGIGLSLTKSLVEIHKGSIQVKSRVDEGSTFCFSVPVEKQVYDTVVKAKDQVVVKSRLQEKIKIEFETSKYVIIPPSPKVEANITGHRNKDYQILVVDDNPEVLSMLCDIIPDKYGIHQANSGLKALDVLDKEKIDLVVSDVIMPEMDGLALCSHIKSHIETSHIPVILLTAKAEIENRIEGLQVGADSYIPKPFHPDHLLIRIEKLIESRELLRDRFKQPGTNDEEVVLSSLGKQDNEFISRIAGFIQKEMNDTNLDADQIASFIGMSKTSLYKKVKSITGLTPHLLINQYRLRKAAYLLKNSSMNVSEIIDETGFNSRSYFYKSFSELFNCSPKDYK